MSWAGAERLDVYLGESIAGLRRAAGRGSFEEKWASWGADAPSLAAALRGMVGQHSGLARQRARAWLSGSIARPFLFKPPSGLRLDEAPQVAASMAPEATGLRQPCLAWVGAADADGSCVAIAMEREARDRLEESLREAGIRLVSMRPWWAAACDERATQRGTMALVDTDSTTMVAWTALSVESATTFVPAPDEQGLEAIIKRRSIEAQAGASEVEIIRLDSAGGVHAASETITAPPFIRSL